MIPSGKLNPSFDNLILLGTVHGDPRGRARLLEFYSFCRPDCILLEFSRHGLDFRLRKQSRLHKDLNDNLRQVSLESGISLKALMKHPEVAAIRKQISLPFEFRASRHYSLAAGIPLCLIDRSDFSRQWIRFWPDLIAPQNLEFLVSSQMQAQGSYSGRYEQAALLMGIGRAGRSRHCLGGSLSPDFEWVKREHHLARKTAAILSKREPRRPVFVGGWRHMVQGECRPTLRDYLNVPVHQCLLLDRALSGLQRFPQIDPAHGAAPGGMPHAGKMTCFLESN